MQLILSLDSIYLGALCKLSSSFIDEHSVKTSAHTVGCAKGKKVGSNVFLSSEDKGRNQVELLLINTISERQTSQHLQLSASRYGTSYYPFISSEFKINFSINTEIQDILIELPGTYRIIWNSISATLNDTEADVRLSMDDKYSIYILSWPKSEIGSDINIFFKVRTGGPFLLRASYFPIYYYFIALSAVLTAARSGHINILFTTIAASWIFLIRHLNSCDLPRRSSLLFHAGIIMGAFLPIWGLIWSIPLTLCSYILLFLLTLTVLIFIGIALQIIRNFERSGILPEWFNRFYGYFIEKSERS